MTLYEERSQSALDNSKAIFIHTHSHFISGGSRCPRVGGGGQNYEITTLQRHVSNERPFQFQYFDEKN